MKLVITGGSGFVATEVIIQSLCNPSITSVIALARRPLSLPTSLPPTADVNKWKSLVVSDYSTYPEDVKRELSDADACIWTVAITPAKSASYDSKTVRKICLDDTMAGLNAIIEARSSSSASEGKPFRFIYMSGSAAERDQTKTPSFYPEYSLMRGETENLVLSFARDHSFDACVIKPGPITAPWSIGRHLLGFLVRWTMGLHPVSVQEVSATMLHQVVNGFDKEPLEIDDIIRIGRRELQDK
ncbi:hypothetical protein PROFUN_10244 [Planoprotostelium fungivorum]|uniref:NAD(P)-binding domain-containing protein n=1 Tax=Planoprotostelium fungivorum TaxID=1890364 RepID=A0A2P6NEG0_9EUKA|nr:hypothetical protein PROFUN_10244 [Planoprotostelium fungivorum]